jgi:hypothetical protein
MNARVLRIHQIDLNKINYLKVKDIGSKKQIYIEYEKKPLVFQCPSLLNENLPIKITDDYYELEIPLITQEKNKQNGFIDLLKKLDSKIVQDANNNVKIWFNENKMSYSFKTIVKDSEKYKAGTIKLKIIKTIKFESVLFLENNKRINIKDVPKDSWVKILLEVHSIIINHENKTFYLFLRPHAFSFKEKEIKLTYNFLEDSDSDEEIPDSDTNNLFLKQINVEKNNKSSEGQTSSQINYDLKKLKNLELNINSNFSSSSSSEKSLKNLSDSNESSSSEESLKNLSDSNESSSSEESLKKLSESEDSPKLSEPKENKKNFKNNFISFDKKMSLTSSSSSSNENDNVSLSDSVNLASILKRN